MRRTWLDACRALAALWVVLHHAFLTVHWAPTGIAGRVLARFLTGGHSAVTFFIVISGFSLSLPLLKNGWIVEGGWTNFMRARFFRIVPPYYCAMFLSLLLIHMLIGHPTGTHWDVSLPVTTSSILGHLFLVQDMVGAPKINHAFWSIAVEFQIYIFFPLVVFAAGKKGIMTGAAVWLAVAVLAAVVPGLRHWSLPGYCLAFGLGMAAATTSVTGLSPRQMTGLFAGIVVIGIAIRLLLKSQHFGSDLIEAGCAALLLYSLERWPKSSALPGVTTLSKVGLFSYSLYLIHAPLLQVVYQVGGKWRPEANMASYGSFVLASVPLILAASYLFYLAFERPSHQYYKRLARRSAEVRPAQQQVVLSEE